VRSGSKAAAAALALVLVSSCGWWSEQGRTTKGAVYGTGAGAATGAAIGGALGGGEGAWKGAAVGAALGALGGGLIGHYMDTQAKEMQRVVDRQDRIERDGEMLRLSLASDVLFDSGSATLQPGAEDKLRHVAEVLQRYPKTRVEIVGHTDNRGTSASNEKLSERRARAVRDVLARSGVDPTRITTRGAGETRPVATNDTLEGRALNRRVEVITTPDETLAAESERHGSGSREAPASEEPR